MTEDTTTARFQARPANSNTTLLNRILLLLTLILKTLLLPLQKLSLLLFPPKEFDGIHTSADPAAKAFHNFFNIFHPSTSSSSSSSSTSNPFSTRGYTKSLLQAHRQQQLCFIYLHSPLHQHSNTFCQLILSQSRVLETLNQCVMWGSSIHSGEGAHVAEMLHVSSYPYCALLNVSGNPSSSSSSSTSTTTQKVELVWKMEGLEFSGMTVQDVQTGNVEKFLRGIQAVLQGYQALLAEIEARRLQREEEVRLREEQDREFQETLLADQERERERLRKIQEEEERQQRLQRQEEEAQQKKNKMLEDCRLLLKDEPPPKTPNTTRLRITLPSGKKMERRFFSNDTIQHVRAFVRIWMHDNDVPIERFSLSSNYPKRTFDEDGMSLEDGGLAPMAVLMIQDLDA